jgi:hypothetical protein
MVGLAEPHLVVQGVESRAHIVRVYNDVGAHDAQAQSGLFCP